MSDVLAAAAAAMGMPEALVQRSAEARAAESGSAVDDVLAAWAGGAPAPAGGAPAPAAPSSAPTEPAAPTEEKATPAVEAEVPASSAVMAPAEPQVRVTKVPYKAPVLVGAKDSTMSIIVGSLGLFMVMLLVGLVGPSIPVDSPGTRSSEIDFSDAAHKGQDLYASLGCAGCHTQMVRPVVADVGLGLVTLNDSNQILGVRRFGPDLSDIGSRATPVEMEAMISGDSGTHPPHLLAEDDMMNLLAYLTESRTTGG